jgi:hypothetical protein
MSRGGAHLQLAAHNEPTVREPSAKSDMVALPGLNAAEQVREAEVLAIVSDAVPEGPFHESDLTRAHIDRPPSIAADELTREKCRRAAARGHARREGGRQNAGERQTDQPHRWHDRYGHAQSASRNVT